MNQPYRVAHLNELDRIDVAGVTWRPIRRRLGVGPFGINAYTSDEIGGRLIEEHDESGSGAGGHEELYVVITGRATFTVAGDEIDAPAGTLVYVADLGARRTAVAVEAATTVLAIGGPASQRLPVSPWEYWFAAEPAYHAGDYGRAAEIVGEGLREHPEHPMIHYQLACYAALVGDREEAIERLRFAADRDERVPRLAAADRDLDSIRDDPRFPSPNETEEG